MKIFLAGASGVIGRSLVPRLTGAGHEVTGMTGEVAKAGLVRSLGAQPVVVDAFDRDRLADVIRAERPDAVIHQLTSLRNGDYPATNRLRTEGTRNLVDAALSAGTRTVVAQSYCIYAPGPGLADETDPLDVNSRHSGPRLRRSSRWRPSCPRRRTGCCCATGPCTGRVRATLATGRLRLRSGGASCLPTRT